jgi:RND family efflux transporter MFP subunit
MTCSQNPPTELPKFPDSVLIPSKKHTSRIRVLTVLVVVALIGAGITYEATDAEAETGNYRTAAVSTQELEQAYTNVATVEPVTQAEVSFPVAGTVATVGVAVGDEVSVGDTLATLDTEDLEEELRAREAELAHAELVLSIALDGDDPSSVTGGMVGASADEEATVLLAVYTPGQEANFQLAIAGNDEVTAAQEAVLEAQEAVDKAITQAAAALDSAELICTAVDQDTIDACRSALNDVTAAQKAVSDAQAQLATAASQLDDLLEQWAEDLDNQSSTTTTNPGGESTTTTTPGTPSTSNPGTIPGGGGQAPNGRGSGGGFSSGGSAPASESPSSEDLIAYQSAVDAAELQVEVAEQALAQASIVSPISGTVTSVEIAPGDEVTAAAETQTIVIEGAGGYEATLMVSINDIPDIELGQAASLLPDGSASPVTGEVVQISAVPKSDSSNTTTYQVTVALEDPSESLRNGNIGDIDIVTGQTDSVLAVPSSAVSLVGTNHMVTVVNDDLTVSTVNVTLGVVGGTWVEIASGDLSEGQSVMIADLDEALPGSATEVSDANTITFPGGGQIQFPAGGGGGPAFQTGP